MKVYDILPPASPRQGFLRTASAWKDAALVEFGPEGTMHYAQSNIPGETPNLFTTGMEESQIIFGDTANLEACIREVDRTRQPRLLLVTSSPVSEIIGVDLRAVQHKLQPQIGARILVWDPVPLDADETMGRTAAFQLAAGFLRTLEPADSREGLLVLGLDQTDYNGLSDLNELRRMARDYFGLTCLNDELGRYELRDLSRAGVILAAAGCALPMAREAERLWGTPVLSGLPWGLEGSQKLVDGLAEALDRQPADSWKQDAAEARRCRDRFRRMLRARPQPAFVLRLEPERGQAWQRWLTGLGLTCVLESPDYAPPEDPHQVLVGSGILCSLYRENPGLCVSHPALDHYRFGEHSPWLGIRGEGNLMTELARCLRKE